MVAIQGISLDSCATGNAGGALAFTLTEEAQTDRLYHFSGQTWEVELRHGCNHVVARTTSILTRPALLNSAIDFTHRALDLMSIEEQEHLGTLAPASDHVLLVQENEQVIVRFAGVEDFRIGLDLSIEARRADGTVEPQAVAPTPNWTPAFRFYRLAQSGRDLFDAYRNMFLALEALLDQLFPKTSKERKKVWLLRAVAAVGTKVNLANILSSGAINLAQDIVDRLYGVRVQVFHAKSGRTLLPDERAGYIAVAEAYRILVRLCTDIIRQWLDPPRGGGVVTYQGFRFMIENAFAAAIVAVTADDTPPERSDVDASPAGLPVVSFASPVMVSETTPGRMTLEGRTTVAALPTRQAIGRVVILVNGEVTVVGSITGGLVLDGAHIFETATTLRLVNRDLPRTEFL